MFNLACCAILIGAATMPVCAPEDDLDRALRAMSDLSTLTEGVDYEVDQVSGAVLLYGNSCFTQSNLRCIDQAMPCKHVGTGGQCIYCDGTGGMFMATNGFCTPDTGINCLVNPAGQTGCGKQRRSTCAGGTPTGGGTCTTVATPSTANCNIKECT